MDVFNPTAVLLIKVDTVELYSKNVETLGYAILNVFTKKGDVNPPDSPDQQEFCLNAGNFQLPLKRVSNWIVSLV